MRYSLLAATLLSFFTMAADVDLKIELPINGRSQDELRMAAFIEAKSQAADRLPTVIVGVERQITTNELSEYSQTIKGLDAGALKMVVKEEVYTPKDNRYVMLISAQLDEKLSLSLLSDIQAGQQAITHLKTAYQALDGKVESAVQAAAVNSKNWSLNVPDDLSPAWFARPTDKEAQDAELKYKKSMLAMLYAKYQHDFSELVKFSVLNERAVRIDVPFDWEGVVEKPLHDAIDQKLGRPLHAARRARFAEPCLVEYRKNSTGQEVVLNDISLRRDPSSSLVSANPRAPYSVTARLTNLYDEMEPSFGPEVRIRTGTFTNSTWPTGVRRNLMNNAPWAFKVKFCFNDPEFYAEVLRARSIIEGLSKK